MATIKQKKAIDKIVENHGNISKSMLEAGYDPTTAKNPKNLTESKAWGELVTEKLKDTKLLEVLNEGLEATKQQGVGGMAIGMKGEKVESMGHTDVIVPDYAVRHKYLETGLKLKNRFPKEQSGNIIPIQININEDRSEFN